MKGAGRGVQHEVEFLGDGAHALQGAPQQGGEVDPQAGVVQSGTLERRFVVAGQNPGLVRGARRVGTEGKVVAAGLDDALRLTFFLLDDVASTQRSLLTKNSRPARSS